MATSATVARACLLSDDIGNFHPLTSMFSFCEWARHYAPVFFSHEVNSFVVTRYANIKAVLNDWETFSAERPSCFSPICEEMRRIMCEGGFTAYSGLRAHAAP